MCYIDVIDTYYLVLKVWLVGAFNTAIHVINFIFYICCVSLKEINVLFWWGDPGVPVDEDKVLIVC